MRRLLNGLYGFAEWAAMAALAAIAVMVLAQVLGRVLDAFLVAFGWPPYGFLVPSLAEFAGFLLVAASFLALAGSLKAGAHIRVTLGIANLPSNIRRPVEMAVLAVAAALASIFCWYSALLAVDSYRFGEVSYGIVAVPLWIPQAAMATGVGVFAVALADELVVLIGGDAPSYLDHEAHDEGRVE